MLDGGLKAVATETMTEWQLLVLAYFAAGALVILTTRARKEVLGALTKTEIERGPTWKVIVFFCIIVPVALLLWPLFVPSWFRRKETVWDQFQKAKGQGGTGLKELFDVMNSMAEHGCDSDEIPGGTGEFGWEPSNPIPTRAVLGSTSYLNRLRSLNGESISYERVGSFDSLVSEMPVDGYEIIGRDGEILGVLYLSPYHQRNSEKAPTGLNLALATNTTERQNVE